MQVRMKPSGALLRLVVHEISSALLLHFYKVTVRTSSLVHYQRGTIYSLIG
jgi:hypothetical protein